MQGGGSGQTQVGREQEHHLRSFHLSFTLPNVKLFKLRVECSLVSMRNRKTWPHRAWFVARACLKVQAEGYAEKDRINNKKSRAFGDLVDRKDLKSLNLQP